MTGRQDSAMAHAHALAHDLFSFTSLIFSYTKSSRFGHALLTFSQMVSQNIYPDHHIMPTILKACAALSALEQGKQVHASLSVSGFALDSIVQSSLVHMYTKCNQVTEAHKVFDRMSEPDVFSWSALVASYARQGRVSEAKGLFYEAQKKLGLEPNLISWNGMIAGFNQSHMYSEVIVALKEMHSQGFRFQETTVSSVLPAVGNLEDLNLGSQIHCYVIKEGFGWDKCVVSALLDMYGRCASVRAMLRVFDEVGPNDVVSCNALITGLARNGLADYALRVFKQFKGQAVELNVVSWTSMISCCSQNGKDIEALVLFREMQNAGEKPNKVTIPSLLPACVNIAALMHGKAIHAFSLRTEISNDVYVGSALIDMYANCGKISEARVYFDGMPIKNLVCWNVLIGGYAMHGKAKEVIEIFDLMLMSGEKPNSVSFTSVLSACSQSGLTDKGWHYFNSMSQDHGIEPRVEHYACMVSLLSRVGKLEEAYSMIEQMPVEPDACVWGSLLNSCKIHKNLELGETAAKKLFELEPTNPGNYILLSNIYASKGMWNDVNRIREDMRNRGLRKNPGYSWIEIKNTLHILLAGDKTHPQMNEILEKLEYLILEMKKSGCLPSVDDVLQDVDEQDKEQILCGHSEKLAVGLGLLNTPPGSSLRVIKNLRICGDCHSFMKFVSSFEGREILVRDANGFHHFKDGVCSCGEYWLQEKYMELLGCDGLACQDSSRQQHSLVNGKFICRNCIYINLSKLDVGLRQNVAKPMQLQVDWQAKAVAAVACRSSWRRLT
ncbi:DYW domain [Dillenia turbinata]|uniref:DYW domain n=1 Tax=Dillenia turbinata TaxID=194707 RepID=A0AAN8VDH1_9MAGN